MPAPHAEAKRTPPGETRVLTAGARREALDNERQYREDMRSEEVVGQKTNDLSKQPEPLRSIFNGVTMATTQARPSKDTGADYDRLPKDLVESEVSGMTAEDLNKSRDDKPGGLVSAKTTREQSIEEASHPAVSGPTSTQDDLKTDKDADFGPSPPTGGGDQEAETFGKKEAPKGAAPKPASKK